MHRPAFVVLGAALLAWQGWQPSRVAGAQAAAQPPAAPATHFVGTWLLTEVERVGTTGPGRLMSNPRGVLIADAAGNVIEVVARGDRAPAATFQLTAAEALTAFAEFDGFWGRYALDPAGARVTYQVEAGVDPNLAASSIERSFTFGDDETGDGVPDRLTLASSRGRPDAPMGLRWRWERVPTLDPLPQPYASVAGFWRHEVEWRETADGARVPDSESRRDPSVIVYSPAGFVGVHFPPRGRNRYTGTWPTEQEAQSALQGYVGYYGTISLHPGAIYHHRLALLGRAQGDTLRRFYRIDGDTLTLRFPLAAAGRGGPPSRTMVRLRRMSDLRAMLPGR